MRRFIIRCWRSVKLRLPWLLFRLLPVDPKKIVISSYYGRGYGDNPKYIVEKLLGKRNDLRIIWLVKNADEKSTLPVGVEACEIDTVKCVYHLMTAKVWIDNCRKFFIMFKRKSQFYIQTWHGFALKRIEKDAQDKLAPSYVKSSQRDSGNIDYIISCSRFMSDIYRNAFWYDGKVLEYGAPRNDLFLNTNAAIKEKVHKHFGFGEKVKIVLYAPTFRADGNMDVYSVDYARVLDACQKRFGGEFAVITRLHPNIAKQSDDLKFDSFLKNGSYYPDMQELMVASDIIITDYSSVMFDFALSNRPCFQYATDIGAYKDDRNFYFEIDKLPFALATNNDELEQNILNFDEDIYRGELTEFYDRVGMVRDGKASERCANLIMKIMDKAPLP